MLVIMRVKWIFSALIPIWILFYPKLFLKEILREFSLVIETEFADIQTTTRNHRGKSNLGKDSAKF